MDGALNCLKAAEPLQEDSLLFTTEPPRRSWYSFDQPWRNERLIQFGTIGIL